MDKTQKIFRLDGKVAVVTGGAVNIGRSIVEKLASAGATVALVYFSSENEAKELVLKLGKEEKTSIAVRADVRSEEDVVDMTSKIFNHFGKIDILVNNSGVFGLSEQHDLNVESWELVHDINLKGLFLCTREVVKIMMKNQIGGNVVNIASINGLHPGFGKTAHYDASKGGVIAYTKSLAAELAKYKIRVNAVAPGLVESAGLRENAPELAEMVSKRTPLKRIAKPEDVANAVLFLTSEASSFITGEVIVVDGGYLLT